MPICRRSRGNGDPLSPPTDRFVELFAGPAERGFVRARRNTKWLRPDRDQSLAEIAIHRSMCDGRDAWKLALPAHRAVSSEWTRTGNSPAKSAADAVGIDPHFQ